MIWEAQDAIALQNLGSYQKRKFHLSPLCQAKLSCVPPPAASAVQGISEPIL